MAVEGSGLFLTLKADIIDATQLAYNPLSDTMRVALFPNTVTPNFETDTAYNVGTWSSANEVAAGGGYVAGGATLGTKTITISNGAMIFDAADIIGTWTSPTFTPRCALLWDDTVSDRAVYLCDFGGDYPVVAQPFNIVWDPTGIYGELF